jgi:hypothetical protein
VFRPEQQVRSAHAASQIEFAGLRIVRDLFAGLHEADLAYCHWKSNEHLDAAVEGLTDLDILVERGRTSELQRVLADSGFRRFAAPPLRAYPAIEDYLGFDDKTGRLVHLHLHYQLTLGEPHLKGYRLPWEARLLATRRRDSLCNVDVADPALELLLLLVRAALKQRARDRLRAAWGGRSRDEPGDFSREFAWLRARVDDATLRATARDLIGPGADEMLCRLLEEPVSPTRLKHFARVVRNALRLHRTYGLIEARLRAWLRELQWLYDAVNRRYLHRATPLRRISPRGGSIIVVVGADGSGKSTLARTLVSWLGVKLDAMPIYFGSGDGPSAWYRRPLKLAHRMLQPLIATGGASSQENRPPDPAATGGGGRLRAAARIPWALVLSCEKRGKIRRMIRARNRGMIVVCDRFPQADILGFNDGPLLSHWRKHPWRLCRACAAWEAKPYAAMSRDPPDLVIKLAVSPAMALTRRPEMSLEQALERVRAVRIMTFPPPTRVAEIDADAPLDAVALAAKRLVWEAL